MKPVTLSSQKPDLKCSQISYGVWRLADQPDECFPKHVQEKIETCLELGMTTMDHADIYGNYSCEELFGKTLVESPALRSKIQIIPKAGIKLISPKRPEHKIKSYDTSRQHLTESLERSLKNLATDHVDLFLIHRPDPFMDPEETGRTLDELVSSGKTKAVGVSNFLPHQCENLQAHMKEPLVTNQVELSLLQMNPLHDGTVDHCQKQKMSPMAWSPLGGGQLFAKDQPTAARIHEALSQLGERYDASVPQMALAWLLAHPAKIIPVIGTNKLNRIKELCQATSINLSRQDWFELWQAAAGQEVP